jgi:hypothetical protein
LYGQTDYNGNLTDMWRKMPHQMLAKCCEALVRRMAFPAALSGIYTREEMMSADSETPVPVPTPVPPQPPQSPPQAKPQYSPAQQQVLDRKLAEIQQRKNAPATEPPAPPEISNGSQILSNAEFGSADKVGKLEAFTSMMGAIGGEQFYRILGALGATNTSEFRNIGEAKKAYAEMLITLGEMNISRGTV